MKGVIREISVEEVHIVEELAHRIWPSAFMDILTPAQIDYMLQWMYNPTTLVQQLTEGHHFFLIYDEKEPVGFVGIAEDVATSRLKLHKLYILPELKGTGFGKQLFQFVENWAKQREYKAVYLNVNRFNKAVDFYHRQGMVILFEENIDIGEGYWMEDYVMEKVLVF